MSRQYQRKCIRVEAAQYTYQDSFRWLWDDCRITAGKVVDSNVGFGYQVYDSFADEWRSFKLGDWILKGEHGEYYPMCDEVFKATFMQLSDSDVVGQVIAERDRQLTLWGVQTHPAHSGAAVNHLGLSSDSARDLVETLTNNGTLTWADIAIEELAEALDAPTKNERIEELVQVAAVIVSWIEAEMWQ